jgi:hypothetical protein
LSAYDVTAEPWCPVPPPDEDPPRTAADEPFDPWRGYPSGVELPAEHEPDAGYLA